MSTIEAGPFYIPRISENSPVLSVASPEKDSPLSANLRNLVENMDTYLLKERLGINKKPLMEDQMRIFEKVRNLLARGKTKLSLVAAPGWGKSVFLSKLAEVMAISGQRVLISTETTVILDQIAEEIGRCTEGMDVGKVYQGGKVHGKQITLTTHSSFLRGVENGSITSRRYPCRIYDESHLLLGQKRQKAVLGLQSEENVEIGFTATPKYSPGREVKNILPTQVCDISIKQSIDSGRLVNSKSLAVMVDIDYSDKSQDKRGLRVNSLMQAILSFYLNNSVDGVPIKGQRALICCGRIKDAERSAEFFRKNDISSYSMTGHDHIGPRKKKIKSFKSGEITVGTTAKLLSIGYDDPGLVVCLMMHSTFSPVDAEQRLRNLRKNLDNKGKRAIIVDFFPSDMFRKSRIPISSAVILNDTYTFDAKSNVTRGPNRKKAEAQQSEEVVVFDTSGMTKMNQARNVIIDVEQATEVSQKVKPDATPFDVAQWKTFADIALSLNITEEILFSLLREKGVPRLGKRSKNWGIVGVIGDDGRLTKRIPPSMEEQLRALFHKYKTLPIAGGRCVNDVVKEMKKEGYGVSNAMVTKSFLKVGRENLDEVGVHKHSGTRRDTRYLSAEGVNLVRKDIIENKLKYSVPPNDWITITKLYLRLKRRYSADYEFVKAEAESLRGEDSSGFGLFRAVADGKGGATGIHEYLSLENVLRIEKKARMRFENKPPFAEERWMSYGDYERSRGIHYTRVKNAAGGFRPDRPDWFAINSRMTGKPSEHMHPDLVEKLDLIFGVEKVFSEHIVFNGGVDTGIESWYNSKIINS